MYDTDYVMEQFELYCEPICNFHAARYKFHQMSQRENEMTNAFYHRIQQLFQVRGGRKQHRYPTRNKALPNVQSHSGNILHTSFMCKSLSAYSSLLLHLQRVQKMGSFVKKTKQLFLSNY